MENTILILLRKKIISRVLVAHACNPRYSGGRDQEDHNSRPAWANSLPDPISKTHITKRTGRVAQGPEFKPQYWRGGKKERRERGRLGS
jgi:hypothetical protein